MPEAAPDTNYDARTEGRPAIATLLPGTAVDLSEHASEVLRFATPDADLVIVVHPAALRARWDGHTQVANLGDEGLGWLGALVGSMPATLDAPPDPSARAACAERFPRGGLLWQVVRPGALLRPDAPHEPSTIYADSDRRPWVVIGETDADDPIAAPLDEASNPKWWMPVVPQAALAFRGNDKDAQLELAHAWSLPATVVVVGDVTALGRGVVERAVRAYVGA